MMIHKVLLATMSLGIGGAETHIIELALELKRRGLDVSVASNGGVYTVVLDKAGIPHHTVPMDRRSLSCMLMSFFKMMKIIRKEKPDIVHAHARIPGFICGLLHKLMRFKFVTTAHWVFDVGHGLRYLTNWGEKTIAVSDDIKQYLIDGYDLDPGDIFVTFNGIDTEKFSPEIAPGDVISEFGLVPDRPIICNVSRLDERAAVASRKLLELAEELYTRLPGVQILIAGDGDIYNELKAKADSVNASTGTNTVIMAGARTDINKILAACDLFVGVSRAALEAMASGKPVIIAGSEGYIGLFEPDKLKTALDTNFCCRGCAETSRDMLLDDIVRFFSDVTETRKTELAAFGRSVVIDNYSVNKMTDDCVRAYESAYRRKYNVVLSGYYGFRNAGDEAILQSIHSNISNSSGDISITVLSYDPADTKARYGYYAVNRFNFLRVLSALRRCDALISGGGSLLQDFTSTRSLLYYLFIINMAKRMGKKVMIYSNGIGPVAKKANRRRVRRAIERADVVTLRDPSSLDELHAMGVVRDDILVTADPVFTMRRKPLDESLHILEKYGIPSGPFVAVSIRDWPGMSGLCEKIAAVCDSVYEKFGHNVIFVPMQSEKDAAVSRTVQGIMKNPSIVLEGRFMPDELVCIIGAASLILAMRLHALIFAAHMCVPFAGIVYDPKVAAYTNVLGMPSVGNVSDFDVDSTLDAIRLLIEKHDEYTGKLELKSRALEEAAMKDAQLILQLLESIC